MVQLIFSVLVSLHAANGTRAQIVVDEAIKQLKDGHLALVCTPDDKYDTDKPRTLNALLKEIDHAVPISGAGLLPVGAGPGMEPTVICALVNKRE